MVQSSTRAIYLPKKDTYVGVSSFFRICQSEAVKNSRARAEDVPPDCPQESSLEASSWLGMHGLSWSPAAGNLIPPPVGSRGARWWA